MCKKTPDCEKRHIQCSYSFVRFRLILMSYSCRRHLVALTLLGFTLLGASLLVRSRLPYPKTLKNTWLWAQGGNASALKVIFKADGHSMKEKVGFKDGTYNLTLTSHEAIREFLHSLADTPAFTPRPRLTQHDAAKLYFYSVLVISLDNRGDSLILTRQGSQYVLSHINFGKYVSIGNSRTYPYATTLVRRETLSRFEDVFQADIVKANESQVGYSLPGFYE